MSFIGSYIENPGAETPEILGKLRRQARYGLCKLINRLRGDFSLSQIPLSWKGKPSRTELVKAAIHTLGAKRYLEIGCDLNQLFDQIDVPHKIGVDPASGGTHRMTSDAFFAQNKDRFDVIFIDGLHVCEQVQKDIANSLACLNEGGVILLHDCLPRTHRAQVSLRESGAWNGDVWKAIVEARTNPQIDTAVCLIDQGVGVIKKRRNTERLSLAIDNPKTLRYQDLALHYQHWLRPLEYSDALAFISNPTT